MKLGAMFLANCAWWFRTKVGARNRAIGTPDVLWFNAVNVSPGKISRAFHAPFLPHNAFDLEGTGISMGVCAAAGNVQVRGMGGWHRFKASRASSADPCAGEISAIPGRPVS